MSEAPKKIWSRLDTQKWYVRNHHGENLYIRADLVDELVGALEAALSHDQPYIERSRAALAKIKEEI